MLLALIIEEIENHSNIWIYTQISGYRAMLIFPKKGRERTTLRNEIWMKGRFGWYDKQDQQRGK